MAIFKVLTGLSSVPSGRKIQTLPGVQKYSVNTAYIADVCTRYYRADDLLSRLGIPSALIKKQFIESNAAITIRQ